MGREKVEEWAFAMKCPEERLQVATRGRANLGLISRQVMRAARGTKLGGKRAKVEEEGEKGEEERGRTPRE